VSTSVASIDAVIVVGREHRDELEALSCIRVAAFIPAAAHGHDCSGGAEGGMDATGNQCNPESVAMVGSQDRTKVMSTRVTKAQTFKRQSGSTTQPKRVVAKRRAPVRASAKHG
jgi:hypothetical protein